VGDAGVHRHEIAGKFDEIVSFAETEKPSRVRWRAAIDRLNLPQSGNLSPVHRCAMMPEVKT